MSDAQKHYSILIVEDNPLVSAHIKEVLELFGCVVTGCASSGIEAIALAERNVPQLAIIDIHLAGSIDGVEVAQALLDRLGVPTLFLSGGWGSQLVKRAQAVRPVGLLAKPFRPSHLMSVIEQALSQSEDSTAAGTDPTSPR
jgi:CheY-like chemotaxis protein